MEVELAMADVTKTATVAKLSNAEICFLVVKRSPGVNRYTL